MFRRGNSGGDSEARLVSESSADLGGSAGSGQGRFQESRAAGEIVGVSPDLSAIWNELMGLKDLVENEHDRKLRRIESDLRWTMTLVAAQFITLIGSAIGVLAGG